MRLARYLLPILSFLAAIAGAQDDRAERAWTEAMRHRDPQDRWRALQEFRKIAPEPPDEPTAQVLIRSAIAAHAWDDADELIHRMPRKEPMWLMALAEGLMASHTTLDRASVLAKEAVNAARNYDVAHRPAALTAAEFEAQRAFELPLALRIYGRTLVRLGYPALAEKVYAEAFELLGGKDPDTNDAYVAVLKQLGHTEKAKETEKKLRDPGNGIR